VNISEPVERARLENLLRQSADALKALDVKDSHSGQASCGGSQRALEPFPAPPYFNLESLEALLRHCADAGASGIHFGPGMPVTVSIHGRMESITQRALSNPECATIAKCLHNDEAPALVLSRKPVRSAYAFHYRGRPYRFRLQMTAVEENFHDAVHIVARVLPPAPPSFTDLNLPQELQDALLRYREGMIVVSGPTASGKTTLLASVLLELANCQPLNILTYEEPIEYVHRTCLPNGSVILATEIGRHVDDWETAVTTALRREPHIILVGELLDQPTLMAIQRLSMTGHLCLTTLHATGFAATLNMLFNLFPEAQRKQALRGLLQEVRLIISQRLIPCTDGTRTAVWEYLEFKPAVVERLLDTDNIQLTSKMILPDYGYRFKNALDAKLDAGLITDEVYRWGLRELCGIIF